jgi:hypothetical protein
LFLAATSVAAQTEEEQSPQQQCLAAHEQAQIQRMDSKLIEAMAQLRKCSEAECPAFIRGDCIRWLEEVHNAIPTVSLVASSEDGDESDVEVFIDDELLTDHLDGRAFELNPGIYVFRFERPPADPVVKRVILREGEKNRLVSAQFDLRPDPKPEPAEPVAPEAPAPKPVMEEYRPVPFATYVLSGTALVAGATAGLLGASATNSRDDAEEACAPLCSDADLAPTRRRAIAADVSAGIAIAAAGAAVYFYVKRPTRQRPVQQARFAIAPLRQGAVLGVSGGFR